MRSLTLFGSAPSYQPSYQERLDFGGRRRFRKQSTGQAVSRWLAGPGDTPRGQRYCREARIVLEKGLGLRFSYLWRRRICSFQLFSAWLSSHQNVTRPYRCVMRKKLPGPRGGFDAIDWMNHETYDSTFGQTVQAF